MTRIATRHVSRYRYEAPVVASYNEVRMTPSAGSEQSVLASDLSIAPKVPMYRYTDYWSTAVHAFDIDEPHMELSITAKSLVETSVPVPPDPGIVWSAVQEAGVQDRFAELLVGTRYTPLAPELEAIARKDAEGASPLEAVGSVVSWVRRSLVYQPGATGVSTSAVEAWHRGAGVCQDFAHLTLVLLRQLGIPARYVSGYVHPDADAELGTAVAATSHAWVEAWVGKWYAVDPTSGEAAGDLHVTLARGRDYGDVAPMLGVYHGGSLQELQVEVELARRLRVRSSAPRSPVVDDRGQPNLIVDDASALRAGFNSTIGVPRLVLLVSPTCPVCLDGVRLVIAALEELPVEAVVAHVVWVAVLADDDRAAARAQAAMFPPGATARHYWDGKLAISKAFHLALDLDRRGRNVAWDVYLFYEAEASWADQVPQASRWMQQLRLDDVPELDRVLMVAHLRELMDRSAHNR